MEEQKTKSGGSCFCRIRNQTQWRHVGVVIMAKNHHRWLESQIRYFVHVADSRLDDVHVVLIVCAL